MWIGGLNGLYHANMGPIGDIRDKTEQYACDSCLRQHTYSGSDPEDLYL